MNSISKVGVIGSGSVAKALALGFAKTGHQVMVSNRDKPSVALNEWASSQSPTVKVGSFAQAAEFGQIIVIATLGLATEQAVKKAGLEHFNGKVVLDVTNPLDFSKGFPPTLAGQVGDSGGERIQRLLVQSQVVKAFNTVGNSVMFRPKFADGRPDMFICGDHDDAKKVTSRILDSFGWNSVDVGAMNSAHYLEAMAMIWILSASYAKPQRWDQAFKLIRPSA